MRQINLNQIIAHVFTTQAELLDFMLKNWRSCAERAIAQHGCFNVALSGGRTPLPFYTKLSTCLDLPWDKTHIFLTDERFVSLDDEDSNYAHLNHFPTNFIHFVDTNKRNPKAAASDYATKLRDYFQDAAAQNIVPRFDLILLGVGEDGHMTSLFPGNVALQETKEWAIAAQDDNNKHPRVTLTLPVINAAQKIMFLVTGERKANIVKKVFVDRNQILPAAAVDLADERAVLVLDAAAAQEI